MNAGRSIALPLAVLLAAPAGRAAAPSGKALAQLLESENRGVSLMERHQFADAAAEFEKVVKAAPDFTVGWVNLGIAHMNAAKEYGKAEAAFQSALKLDPKNPYALFSLGVMLESLGRKQEALERLKAAAEVAPDDPDIQFKLGQSYQGAGDMAKAESCYRKALELAPGFQSALYALGLLEVRGGRRDEGKAHLDQFEALRSGKQGKTWGLKYTEMGRYADVIRLGLPPGATTAAASSAPAITFKEVTTQVGLSSSPAGSLSVADVDGDGAVDIVVGGAAVMFLRNGKGKLVDASGSAGLKGVTSPTATLADVDNDGDLDLWLTKPGRVLTWNAGKWGAPQLVELPGAPQTMTVAEADSDGDVDLVVAGKPSYLLVNNRDGTWQQQAKDPPLAKDAVAALAFDADGDMDSDLLLLGAAPALLRNDLLWRFTPVAGVAVPTDAVVAAAGDLDGDGALDVALAGKSGVSILRNDGGMRFTPKAVPSEPGATVAVADLDLDGHLDIIAGRDLPEPAIVLLRGDGHGSFAKAAECPLHAPAQALVVFDQDDDGDCDILASTGAAGLRLYQNVGAEKQRGLQVTLRGPEKASEARANRLGIDALVEVKAGGTVEVQTRSGGSGLSQSLGPLVFGLDGAAKADYVRIVWPDGVIQSEIEVAAGRPVIDEVQRKAGSCPTLFAWDGARFRFVADFLGGGGVGFYVAPGSYGPPDPTESVLVPGLAARDGRLELRIVEPLEELSYVDRLELLAIEHPRDVEIVPDERFALAEPLPTGEPLAVRDRVFPRSARFADGRDATEALRDVDRRYAGPARKDPRFLGLSEPAALTLSFDEPLPADGILFLHGWIEYGYSATVFASAQAGLSWQAPALDYRDPSSGEWREAALMGYPAGTPRMMTYPLSGRIPAGVTDLRIRTNMTISWDQAYVARDASPDAIARVTRLQVSSATLRFKGFPREYSPDGTEPTLYDYDNVDPTKGFKHPAGTYTRFGDVAPLLSQADDRYVIMGPGEEIAVAFDARAVPPPAAGNTESYILASDGFCKDMDLYTAEPFTVGPLPFHAMSAYPYPATEHFPDDAVHERYQREWNTRVVEGAPAR